MYIFINHLCKLQVWRFELAHSNCYKMFFQDHDSRSISKETPLEIEYPQFEVNIRHFQVGKVELY